MSARPWQSIVRSSRGWLALRLLALIGLIFATGGVAGAQQAYTGVQPRTPLADIPPGGQMRNFTLVGQNPLIDPVLGIPRGMNGGIAAVRDCLYVGSNIGLQPTLIVDMSDVTNPTVVGELPDWVRGRGNGIEAIEAVPDLNLLVNTVRMSFSILGTSIGFDPPPDQYNTGLLVYDVTDCRHPALVAKFDFPVVNLHYMTLWRDPANPGRVLAVNTFNSGVPGDGIDLRVVDLTGCPSVCRPTQVAEWGLNTQFDIPPVMQIPYEGGVYRPNTQTHDATWSLDGTRIHLAQTHFGYLEMDSSSLALNQSCDPSSPTSPNATGHCLTVLNPDLNRVAPFGNGVATVHGVVKIPGRPYVALAHEGHSCPYGGVTFVYVGSQESFASAGGPGTGLFRGDLFPKVVGSFGIPENQVDRCPVPGQAPGPNTLGPDLLRTTKTVHDLLAFPSVLFASWYSGGLRAIDISNPYSPFELGFFFNKPAPEVRWCGEYTAVIVSCDAVEKDANGLPYRARQILPPDVMARSYPIIMNGHVVYSDENMGVYVLKYTGPHADEIPTAGICISHNPNVTSPGYEPCYPYKT